jgi:hypothetical protein
MTRDDLLAVCRLVVSSRWQDVAMFADASGHVVVWAGEQVAAKRVVDERGQLLGTSGDTTHAHALLLELEAAKPRWRRELGTELGSFVGVVAITTTLVTLYTGEGGEERARHLAELVRDALRERVRPDDLHARVRALVRSQPGRLPS